MGIMLEVEKLKRVDRKLLRVLRTQIYTKFCQKQVMERSNRIGIGNGQRHNASLPDLAREARQVRCWEQALCCAARMQQ